MSMTKTSVKRPLTIIMVFLVVLMFGGIGYSKMPANLMPDIDVPVALVMTQWSGAGPEDIDDQISEPIEKSLSSISNVKTTVSKSSEGVSMVVAQFEYGTDVDEKLNDIRSKIDTVKMTLPDDVDTPSILKMDMNAQAIAQIVVSGEGSSDDIMKYAEDTVQVKLESIDGITSADINGGDKTQINVIADPTILSSYGVSLDTIKGLLSATNKSYPYGSITQGDDKIVIRSVDKVEALEDIKAIQIPMSNGETVSLDKICTVEYGTVDKQSIYRYNGQESLVMDVQKQQDANTVQVMKNVNSKISELNNENSQFNLKIVNDTSEYINSSINDVMKNLILSAVIAFFVILLFLKSGRASFVVAVSIPTSIIGAIALLYFTGETLNMVTLSSLVIAVGMVVDNATVVIENIFKYRKDPNLSLEEAAIQGTNTVSTAVMASTLTTVAIFLPILFTEGFTKIMFGSLAKTLIFALTLSLIVALTLVPSIFAKLSGGKNGAKMEEKPSPIFDKISEGYKNIIVLALKHKAVVILISVGMFIGAIALGATGAIGMDFMSSGDEGMVSISIKLPEGLDLEPSDYYVSMAEEKVSDIPEIETMITQIGSGSAMGSGGSTASISLDLVSSKERKRTTDEIEQDVVERLKVIPDCEINVSQTSSMSMGGSGDAQVDIKGPDLDVLEEIVNQAKANVEKVSGFRNIETSLADSNKEAQFKIDKRKASLLGINTSSIASTLRTAISGSDATTVTIDDYDYDVNLKFKDSSINSIDDIGQIKVTSASGQQVPLNAFAEIKMADGLKSISRTDGDYSVSITAKADNMDTSTASRLLTQAVNEVDMPRDYSIDVGGSAEMMNESMSSLVMAMVIALILVYMVMVAQFESFSKPFIIMFSIPFAFVGVVIALVISRISLNVVGMLGAILLVGIVVNNGIVLIDYIGQLREAKVQGTLEDIVAKGCAARLRPVLMTTMTTVVGMIPSALAFGEGGDMMQPLAVVIIGGLSVSTLVTLVLIPTVYLIFDKIENSLRSKFGQIFDKIKIPHIGPKKSKMDINILSKDIEDKKESKNDDAHEKDSDLKK
ncbi:MULTISPECIES: efflux RND transporter permease subunit [Clostridium]|uniref:efflux RND transporter permease subunit n=1 Tax=Clostridium TaxID=1485 RepID=UPI0005C18263|nr:MULTISPECIES: efflux RND transporter permease subunit [Clostridium]AXB86291.1 AcrB/AcrD/AcrF family protein [Clostridium butyricum]KIU09469.1 acriflavin resistance protein [Clostridium butyricum]MBA8965794.1 HAE1 family hydrophobic/amphiphilic exporter-1 [Clostridium butyricum]MBA8969649.1 HAE1 family hydrophobic/amphiphilic exporter-1 [Clostridium butyricum]MBC2427014.1 efflux RND transporter permease subunit [Clostridium butyricum]